MTNLLRASLLGFLISASLAIVACHNDGKRAVLSDGELANETAVIITAKNNPGQLEVIQVVIASPDGPKSLLGYLNLDGPQSDNNILQATNFTAADGEIHKSVSADGQVVLVIKYYLNAEGNDPQVVVFSGKTLPIATGQSTSNWVFDENSLKLMKDENYLKNLNLEEQTGFSREELIAQLQSWLAEQGIDGLESFAQSFVDNQGN